MISRHTPAGSRLRAAGTRFLPLCLLSAVLVAPQTGGAGELMPFETPEDPIPWEEVEFGDFNTSLPVTAEEAPTAPVDTGPDWQPPPIDAYVDVAFANADLQDFGYNDAPGGYRLIAGFLLQGLGGEHWTIAPEIGTARVGRAERKVVTQDNTSSSQYNITRTDTYTLDISSLDFGVRVGLVLAPRISPYLRSGLQIYHVSDKHQVGFEYEAKNAAPPRDPETQRPSSSADARVDPYASLGLAVQLGKVPSLYGEYCLRRIDGENVGIAAVGVLLNF